MKIELRNDTVCYGNGSGHAEPGAPAIVFLHGAGFDHGVWVMPARYFARHGFNVVAPDLPGHGASAGPALTTIESMADWLHELLKLTCTGPVTLIGHSMGTLIALAYARKFDTQVQRIALLGTANPMAVGGVLLDAAADNHPAAFDMANTWSHSHGAGLGASQTPGQSNFYAGRRWLQRMPQGVYHADLNACNTFRVELDGISQPTLIITGDKDKMTPSRLGEQVAAALPQARTVSLQGCGHSMLTEQPNAVLDALAGFVSTES